jgi:hypothetical protein
VLDCDDLHACTDDGCDAAAGCTHVPRTGMAGATCRVTQLRTLVATLPADLAALSARLGKRLDCVESRLAAAEASSRPRASTRAARRARRCVVRFAGVVKRAPALDAAAREGLQAEAERAVEAIDALRAG